MASNDLTGHTLGQYTITARLGRGGMADVYKAYHPKLEVYRAIKVIRPEFVTAEDFRERFQKEAQAVAALRHPNIVQIHDFGEQDDSYYMVMEFIEGQDLKRIVKAEGKIRPIRRALDIVDQVADALHYAHSRGLVHRDIKPENVMINEDGLPILMDFGIAKLLTAKTQLTQTGMGIGTPAYMAPEQAKALPEIGPPADIYSLSVVLYEMLTGQVPFSADTPMAVMLKAISDPMPMPRQFSSDISEALQQVVLKGTAKDPENRYGTAKQLQKAIGEVRDQEPEPPGEPAATAVMQSDASGEEAHRDQRTAQADKPTDVRTEVRGRTGRPGLGLAVGAVVVLALAAGGYYLWQTGQWQRLAGGRDAGPEATSGEAATGAEEAGDAGPATQPRDEPAVADSASEGERPPGKDPGPATGDTGDVADSAGTEAPRDQPTAETGAATAEAGSVPSPVERGPIEPGNAIRGEIPSDAGSVAYSLDAAPGETIFFDLEEPSGLVDFRLERPGGGSPVFRTRGDHGPVTLEEGGTYKVVAEAGEAASFGFKVSRVEPAVIAGGDLALDQRASGATEVPGQRVTYRVRAEAGQRVEFELADASATTDFTLTAPDGSTRVFKTQGDFGPLKLDRGGTYTLEADPRDDAVADFAFVMHKRPPPMTDGGVLRFGNFVRDRISVPGRPVAYELDAQAGQTIYFDHVDTQQSTRRMEFRLLAPGGAEVFRAEGDHGPVTLERDGPYQLVADPGGNRADDYEFVVWNLETPELDGGTIALGRAVEGETSVPGQRVAYRLRGNAGQAIRFEHLESTEETEFILTAPDGRTRVFRTQGDHEPVVLDQTGTYTLVADPRDDWVAKFEFVLNSAGRG